EIKYYFFRDKKVEQEFSGVRGAMIVDDLYYTNAKGEFRLPVLPTRGVLAYRYSGHSHEQDGIGRFPRGAGAEAIKGGEAMGALMAFPTLPQYFFPTNY